MKKRYLIDLLAAHANALNRVEDADSLDTISWLDGYGVAADKASLLTLLQLAQAIKRALVPISPDGLFRSELQARIAEAEMEMVGKRPFPRKIWMSAAVAGSTLSVIGLLLLILRLLSGRSRPAATAV